MEIAEGAKKGCPVSQLLTGAEISLERAAGEVEQNVDGADSAATLRSAISSCDRTRANCIKSLTVSSRRSD